MKVHSHPPKLVVPAPARREAPRIPSVGPTEPEPTDHVTLLPRLELVRPARVVTPGVPAPAYVQQPLAQLEEPVAAAPFADLNLSPTPDQVAQQVRFLFELAGPRIGCRLVEPANVLVLAGLRASNPWSNTLQVLLTHRDELVERAQSGADVAAMVEHCNQWGAFHEGTLRSWLTWGSRAETGLYHEWFQAVQDTPFARALMARP